MSMPIPAAHLARGDVWSAAARGVQRLAARWRRWRAFARTRREIERLDDAALRDLGIARAEATSLAAELHGLAAATRSAVERRAGAGSRRTLPPGA